MSLALGLQAQLGGQSQVQRAINLLKSKGADAHLWDFSTLTGLFQDSAGTTPVTAPDQPIGLCLDSMGVLGSELAPPMVVGGSWVEADGASTFVTVNNGSISIVTDGLSAGGANFLGGIVLPGKTFRIVVTTTGTGQLKAIYGGSETVFTDSLNVTVPYGASGTSFSFYRVANQAANRVITSVSVREITGIHASQATSAKKPTLRRGVVNRLTYSGDFTNAAWVKPNAPVSTDGTLTPSGSLAAKITASSAAAVAYHTYTSTAGAVFTGCFAVKAGNISTFDLELVNQGVAVIKARFDLTAVTASAIAASPTATIADMGGGYYLCAMSKLHSARNVNDVIGVFPGISDACVASNFVYVAAAAIFQGTLTAQQILDAGGIPLTTTVPASSSSGGYWAEFDSANQQHMVLSGVPFQMADDHAVVAGASLASGGTSRTIFANAAGGAAEAVPDFAFTTTGTVGYYANGGGVTAAAFSSGTYLGSMIAAACRVNSNTSSVRVNGSQVATVAISGTYTTATNSTIGAISRSAVQEYMSGAISSVSAIKSTLTDAELLLIEKLAANKAGISL